MLFVDELEKISVIVYDVVVAFQDNLTCSSMNIVDTYFHIFTSSCTVLIDEIVAFYSFNSINALTKMPARIVSPKFDPVAAILQICNSNYAVLLPMSAAVMKYLSNNKLKSASLFTMDLATRQSSNSSHMALSMKRSCTARNCLS